MSLLKRLSFQEILTANTAVGTEVVFDLSHTTGFCIIAKAESTAPASFTFGPSDVLLGEFIYKENHGCETGLLVRFSTTDTLPSGLSPATDYWLIRNTSNALKVASSLANALAENFITLANGGSGTHTITPQPGAAPTITLEASLDNSVWAPIDGVLVSLSATPHMIESETAFYQYLKVKVALSQGQYNVYSKFMTKGTD